MGRQVVSSAKTDDAGTRVLDAQRMHDGEVQGVGHRQNVFGLIDLQAYGNTHKFLEDAQQKIVMLSITRT